MMRLALIALLPLALLAGCERLEQRLNIPNPAKIEADAKAIGGACRHAGRGLEDCYALNPKAPKAAVFEGWKEMNEYMLKHNMQAVPPEFAAKPPTDAGHAGKHDTATADGATAEGKEAGQTEPGKAEPDKTAKDKTEKDKAGKDKPLVEKPHINLPSREALEKAAEKPR